MEEYNCASMDELRPPGNNTVIAISAGRPNTRATLQELLFMNAKTRAMENREKETSEIRNNE